MKTLRNLLLIAATAGLFSLPASARIEQTVNAKTSPPAIPVASKPAQAAAISQPHIPRLANDQLALSYDVYAGGMHALEADMDLSLGEDAYAVGLQARTEGMIGSLFPWKGEYVTIGTMEKGHLYPRSHESRSIWKQKIKTVSMVYDGQGDLVQSRTVKDGRETVERDINGNMKNGTADMLTAVLHLFQAGAVNNDCEGRAAVFDGKRRFNIVFKSEGRETLPSSKYSSFSGEALRCVVEVEPVAGFKGKDMKKGWMAVQEHTKTRNKPPTIWLASPAGGAPAVPVRMEIASAYGSVVAHLTQTQIQTGTASLKTDTR